MSIRSIGDNFGRYGPIVILVIAFCVMFGAVAMFPGLLHDSRAGVMSCMAFAMGAITIAAMCVVITVRHGFGLEREFHKITHADAKLAYVIIAVIFAMCLTSIPCIAMHAARSSIWT